MANGKSQNVRKVRDGLISKWTADGFSELASDEALARLADARNTSSKFANTFMLIAALVAFLYALKIQGFAGDLEIGQYSLEKLPFGSYVLAVVGLAMSSVAYIRMGDSRGFDRMLRLACEHRFKSDCELRYLAFPNTNAWGESFTRIAFAIHSGSLIGLARGLVLLLVNLFIIALMFLPAATGIDYLANGRVELDGDLASFRFYSIALLTFVDVSMLILLLWVRLSDRD